MIFKEPKNQINYLKYKENEKTKGRHLNIKCDILECLNELIAVYNKNNNDLKINTTSLINIICRSYIQELENKTDTEILNDLKQQLKKELNY